MARIGRRTPSRSLVRKPTIIGAAQVFGAVVVRLAVRGRDYRRIPGRVLASKLRPPTVIGPQIAYAPNRVKLAVHGRDARRISDILGYKLRPPTVVTPAAVPFVNGPLKVQFLVGRRNPRRVSDILNYKLRPPQVVGPAVTTFVNGPVRIELAVRNRDRHRMLIYRPRRREIIASPTPPGPPSGVDAFSAVLVPAAGFIPATGQQAPTVVCQLNIRNPNDATQEWHDLTPYLLSFSTNRSKQRQLLRFEAGTMDLKLRNTDRTFDPTNTSSVFYPNLLPLRGIRVGFIPLNKPVEWVYTGYIERWPQVYDGPNWAEVDLTCVDGFELVTNHVLASSYATLTTTQGSNRDLTFTAVQFGWIGNFTTIAYQNLGGNNALSVNVSGVDITINLATTAGTITSTANDVRNAVLASINASALVVPTLATGSNGTGVVQALSGHQPLSGGTFVEGTSGEYIEEIFSYMGWGGSTNIGTGQSEVQAQVLTDDGSVKALDQIYAAVDTENGQFFFDATGVPTFLDRLQLASWQYRTPKMSLSDYPNDVTTFGYQNVQIDWDKDLIYNDVRVTRLNGVTQTSTDATSQASYFPRTLAISTLNTSDGDALALSQALLTTYKDPTLRFEPIILFPGQNTAFWSYLLQLELLDPVTISRTPPGGGPPITRDVSIIGIGINAPSGPTQGVVWTLNIDPSGVQQYLILDDPTFGLLDTNALGY